MNKYLLLILSIVYSVKTMAVEYTIDTSAVNNFYGVNVDIVSDGDIVSVYNHDTINGNINLDAPVVYLYNNGIINGNINTNGNNLTVYNYGTINDEIINGNIRQNITAETGINNINVSGGNYTVNINGVSDLRFSDIENINATSIMINDSWIFLDDFSDWQNWNKNVTTTGTIHFVIADKNTVNSDGEFINNVSGAQTVIVEIENLDSVERTEIGAGHYLSIVRETNYDIVNNTSGNVGSANVDNSLLSKIRESNPNDKLIHAMDSANGIAEINRIKNKSYRFNHDILLRPVRVINGFALNNIIDDKYDFGAGIKPVYIISDNITSFGGQIYLNNQYNDLYYNIGLNFNRFKYSNNINSFSGMMYGIDIDAKQYINNLWINTVAGLNLTKFDADYIFTNNKIKNNPYGASGYIGTDLGYDFNIGAEFIITPFVGANYQRYNVVDVSNNDFYIRGGIGAKYFFAVDGIKYEYGINTAINNNQDLFAALKFGFWSITDIAGATLNVGFLRDDSGCNYQLSIDAKMMF